MLSGQGSRTIGWTSGVIGLGVNEAINPSGNGPTLGNLPWTSPIPGIGNTGNQYIDFTIDQLPGELVIDYIRYNWNDLWLSIVDNLPPLGLPLGNLLDISISEIVGSDNP